MVTRVFGEDWGRHHSIHVGSVKANIGHSESVSDGHLLYPIYLLPSANSPTENIAKLTQIL